MKTTLRCPTCDDELTHHHPAFRGVAINAIARLSASLMQARESLATLQKKKRDMRGGLDVHDQRVFNRITSLETQISLEEKFLDELRQLEVHHG